MSPTKHSQPFVAPVEQGRSRQRLGWWDRLVDRWYRFRDRLLASPSFQRWAAGFPLTRAHASRNASALFDICAGFVYSQVLYACVRLQLFERVADEPVEVGALAREVGLTSPKMRRLLDAAVALRLLQKRGGNRYGLGVLGAALRGNPGAARMVEHHPMLYRDLADPLALLRGEVARTELGTFWAYATSPSPRALDGHCVADYSALMAESQQFIARDIIEAHDLSRHRRLMDVGGGEGAFLVEVAAAYPHLELMLFDLPTVAERARDRLLANGLTDRAIVAGGDLFSDSLPTGADVISLVRIIHDHDDGPAMAILRAVRDALPAGGTLLLAEPMADTASTLPVADAYFGFYLLAMGRGRPRRPRELSAMIEAAGFTPPREARTRRPMLVQLLVAQRI